MAKCGPSGYLNSKTRALRSIRLQYYSVGSTPWFRVGSTFIHHIYANDLPISLRHSKFLLFADDTTIYYSAKELTDIYNKINYDLAATADWFKANKLTLNISKTNYAIFVGSIDAHSMNLSVQIGNEYISKVQHEHFLGVIIDEKLNWNKHIENCKNKLSSGAYV